VAEGLWKVWGHDTFAREDYLIGEFPTEAEAQRVAREKEERLARTQDEGLRDEVWIEAPKESS
jgi:hypothetical protein